MDPAQIYIHFPFQEGPAGGGNNFLKGLAEQFAQSGNLASSAALANFILFNSHHDIKTLIGLKSKHPTKYFLHRVDGPMSTYTGSHDRRDRIVSMANHTLADGTIFQSNWSRQENEKLGLITDKNNTVIYNAADPAIFFPTEQQIELNNRKIKLVTTGVSSNPNKGLDALRFLDQTLDYNRFTFSFIGTPPSSFKNISIIPPVTNKNLGKLLREQDIFIFPSRYEACSNSLIEALSCGLPSIVFGGTSNIELVRDKRLHFTVPEEIPNIIQNVIPEYANFRREIQILTRKRVAQEYVTFADSLKGNVNPKKLIFGKLQLLRLKLFMNRIV